MLFLATRPRRSRAGVQKTVVAVVMVLVVAAAGLALLYLGGGGLGASSSTSTSAVSSSSSSPSSSSASRSSSTSESTYTGGKGPGLAIGEMFGNVQGPGSGYLSSNGTTIDGDTIYIGNASETLAVHFDVVYANCPASACPTHVTAVNILTPGFTVLDTKPANPIPASVSAGAPAGQVEFHFVVDLKAPSSQYNGPLLLLATVQ